MPDLHVSHLFAGAPVRDLAAALDWYERLFGRPPDMVPHRGEAVWRLAPTGSIYVVHDPERAGKALVTIAVEGLASVTACSERGIPFERVAGDGPQKIVVSDLDGNRIASSRTRAPTRGRRVNATVPREPPASAKLTSCKPYEQTEFFASARLAAGRRYEDGTKL